MIIINLAKEKSIWYVGLSSINCVIITSKRKEDLHIDIKDYYQLNLRSSILAHTYTNVTLLSIPNTIINWQACELNLWMSFIILPFISTHQFIKMHKSNTICLVLFCLVYNSLIPSTKANLVANNTTMGMEVKPARVNLTDVSTTPEKQTCPKVCICNPLERNLEVICTGEEIKSMEQLDLPNRTVSL